MKDYPHHHIIRHGLQYFLIAFSLFYSFTFFVPSVHANTLWTGGDGNWNDSTNWSAGIPISSTDVRILGSSTGLTVTISGDAAANIEEIKSASIHQNSGDHSFKSLWLEGDTNGIIPSYVMDGGSINTGSIDGYIRIDGRGTFTQNSGSVTGDIGIFSGTYILKNGTLSGSDLSLLGNDNSIFTQSGGISTFQNFTGNGVYNFTSGNLIANGYATIGSSRKTGTFTQSAGTSFKVGHSLKVGTYGWGEGGGTYNLSGGFLNVGDNLFIGEYERGSFYQNGGQNLVGGGLYIGGKFKAATQPSDMDSRGNGQYSLDGDGTLTVSGDGNIGYAGGEGSFLQNSGTHTVTGDLYIGYSADSVGSYDLNSGALSVNNLFLGGYDNGRAYFSQNGGTLCGNGQIFITGGQGEASYHLNNGIVNADKMSIEKGLFQQKGGSVNLNQQLQISTNASYEMTSGSLSSDRVTTAPTGFLWLSNGASITTQKLYNSGNIWEDGENTTLTANTIINSGAMLFGGGASIVTNQLNNYSGNISGDGYISGNVLNGGSIYVGGGIGNETAGTLTIGGNFSTYGQGSEFYFYLDGDEQGIDYDFLHILGDAQLGGQLIVSLSSDFNSLSGSIFDLITVDGTLSGGFNAFVLPTFTDGRYFELGYSEHSVFISLLGGDASGTEPVPEPSTVLLLGSGLAGLAFYRRKRK